MIDRQDSVVALRDRLAAAARNGVDGALIAVDLSARGPAALRALPESDQDAALGRLTDITREVVPRAGWARTAWTRHEGVLLGPRAGVIAEGDAVARALSDDPSTGRLTWLVVLTRIFPGEPQRTLCCDANYDLVKLDATSVVWVDPYPGDDWHGPQRYPSCEVISTHGKIL